jgi:hypothetical protein
MNDIEFPDLPGPETSRAWASFWDNYHRSNHSTQRELIEAARRKQAQTTRSLAAGAQTTRAMAGALESVEKVLRAYADLGIQRGMLLVRGMMAQGASNQELMAAIHRLKLELEVQRLEQIQENRAEAAARKKAYSVPIV